MEADQHAYLIIQASLSEAAMVESLSSKTTFDVWRSLELAYHHNSQERMQTLKDTLKQLKKGSSVVTKFGSKFKAICDQVAAMGHLVDDLDKSHWFLSSFETFSTTYHTIKPRPSFCDLVSQAKGHDLFLPAIHDPTPPVVAFTTNR